jgi:hypothetical protein
MPSDDAFSDYTQHLNSFGSGDKAYSSPQTTTVQLWPRQNNVLGTCKTNSAGGMPNPGGACSTLCSSLGS